MSEFWSVPKMWAGQTVVILAGGPSLDLEQVRLVGLARLRGRIRVIAVDDAYIPAFWADLLYGCDWRWWKKHCGAIGFPGIKATLSNSLKHLDDYPDIQLLENTGTEGFEPQPTGLRTGRNGGYQAINLTAHTAPKRIVLLGFDMKADADGRTHWFGKHEDWELKPTILTNVMRPAFDGLVAPLKELGIEVVNATPGSALEAFPRVKLEAVLP